MYQTGCPRTFWAVKIGGHETSLYKLFGGRWIRARATPIEKPRFFGHDQKFLSLHLLNFEKTIALAFLKVTYPQIPY
jgi:hypothetical protein